MGQGGPNGEKAPAAQAADRETSGDESDWICHEQLTPPALRYRFHVSRERDPEHPGINEGLTLSVQPVEFFQCRQLA